jgi:eukaryotic-like serine/threonine-protein kinase
MVSWKKVFHFFLASFLITGLFSCRSNELISVPDLRGLTVQEATAIVEDSGLVLRVKDGTYSSSIPRDVVLAQVPYPLTAVKFGRAVSVKISKGNPVVICPDFVGKTYGEAVGIIRNENLYVAAIHEVNTIHEEISSDNEEVMEEVETEMETFLFPSSNVILGQILSQKPPSGTIMSPGQGIELTVYLPDLPVVPNLLGTHLEDAKYIITHSGYTIGTITFRPNKSFSRGVVYIQEPIPGSPAENQASINVVINEETAVKTP